MSSISSSTSSSTSTFSWMKKNQTKIHITQNDYDKEKIQQKGLDKFIKQPEIESLFDNTFSKEDLQTLAYDILYNK